MEHRDEEAPPVQVRSLTKRYKDGTLANRDITLTIARGELLGVVGPNGAGKTTLVRQITSELLPTTGDIRVFGHDVVSEPNLAKGYMGSCLRKRTCTGASLLDTTCASSLSCAACRAEPPPAAPGS